MDQEYLQERHTQLWEDRTKRVGRVVIASLLFGALLQLNVLGSWSEIYQKQISAQKQIDLNEKKRMRIKELKTNLENFEGTLSEVERVIEDRPWEKEVRNLRRWFINGGITEARAIKEQQADQTVDAIGEIVRSEVTKKLAEASRPLDPEAFGDLRELAAGLQQLKKQTDALPRTVSSVTDLKETDWWFTLAGKEETIERVTQEVTARVQPIANTVPQLKDQVGQKIQKVQEEIDRLNEESEKNEEKISELQDKMDRILPEWIRGLIPVGQMVKIYPAVIVILVLYVLVLAFSASEHYNYMREGLRTEESSPVDPALSSLWTLTDRGKLHSAMTCGAYLLFIGCMWALYELGLRELIKGLEGTNTTATERLAWVGRIVFAAGIAVISWSCAKRKASSWRSKG